MARGSIPQFDLYAELEVSSQATPAVIEAAHRALVKRYHPDVAGGDDLERIKRLNVARDWLLDPARRARYDGRPVPTTSQPMQPAGGQARAAPRRDRPAPRPHATRPTPDAARPARPSSATSFGTNSREVRQFLAELRELDGARAAALLRAHAATDGAAYAEARNTVASTSRIARTTEWAFARDAASVIAKGKLADAETASAVAAMVADIAGAIVVRDLILPSRFITLLEPWTRSAPGASGDLDRERERERERGRAGIVGAAGTAGASGAARRGSIAMPTMPRPSVSLARPAIALPRPNANGLRTIHAGLQSDVAQVRTGIGAQVQRAAALGSSLAGVVTGVAAAFRPSRWRPRARPKPVAQPSSPSWPQAIATVRDPGRRPRSPGLAGAALAAQPAATGLSTVRTRLRPAEGMTDQGWNRLLAIGIVVAVVSIVGTIALLGTRGPGSESAVAGLTSEPSRGLLAGPTSVQPTASATLTAEPSAAPSDGPVATGATDPGTPGGPGSTARPAQTPRPAQTSRPTPTPQPTVIPTATPTPTPTQRPSSAPTATPTPPVFCTVPDLVGVNTSNAQLAWNTAGFTGSVQFSPPPPPQYKIAAQSLAAGSSVRCTSSITVQAAAP